MIMGRLQERVACLALLSDGHLQSFTYEPAGPSMTRYWNLRRIVIAWSTK
jgi:hypothetical protein